MSRAFAKLCIGRYIVLRSVTNVRAGAPLRLQRQTAASIRTDISRQKVWKVESHQCSLKKSLSSPSAATACAHMKRVRALFCWNKWQPLVSTLSAPSPVGFNSPVPPHPLPLSHSQSV